MNALSERLEDFLLNTGGWVSADALAARFVINERALRAAAGRPGLLDDFAISGNQGYKHVAFLTTDEWLKNKHRLRRHAIAELSKINRQSKARSRYLQGFTRRRKTTTFEAHTGQGVML